jgi:glycine/D-amino acid oxidase-like deaminating enzyme/nitrite reductase/ring-hydroxylating ferredoxin subunit
MQSSQASIAPVSFWSATAELPTFEPLNRDLDVDVAVVGGGIAGLTTAYELLRAGRSVAVIEDGEIGSGMTRRTSAHLSGILDDRFYELERLRGPEAARRAADSHRAAVDRIEAIVRAEAIDCGFKRVDAYLFAGDGDPATLDREAAAARKAGVRVEKVPAVPLACGQPGTFNGFDSGPALRFPGQAQFHPLRYLASLARAVEREGGFIFARTHADSIQGGPEAHVQCGKHSVRAGSIVVATNVPVNNRLALHLKLAAYMTYVVALPIKKGSVPAALYWDLEDPYHYVRIEEGEETDTLIVGGEDHRTGQADDETARHGRLEAWARKRFPVLNAPGEFRWGGQVMETLDGLAYIGRNPLDKDNVYVATGDSGMGLTHGTIAGMLLTDLIEGRKNPWEELYDPSRVPLEAAAEFVPEVLHTQAGYKDWVTGSEVDSLKEVAAGHGAVVREGLSKVAVYRDEQGHLHKCSAVCPHLGCIVDWNDAEKTWDCPCHGSRFEARGQVINGPANVDLGPA